MSFQVQLSELEEFWESEYPRFGENGAEGWSSWYSSKLDKHSHSVSSNMQQQNAADLDPYRQWANQELRMDHSMFLSQRSDSESSDPYSIVLFADLRSTLLELRSRDAKHAFRMAWLSFLGLNLPGFSLATNDEGDWDDRWNLNYLTTPQTLDCVFPSNTEKNNLSTDAVAGVVIGRERVYHSPFGPVRCWGRNVSGPLDLASAEPGKVLKRGVWSKGDLPNLEEDFVRRLFLGLKISRDDIEWDVLTLAFELAVNPKTCDTSCIPSISLILIFFSVSSNYRRLCSLPIKNRWVYGMPMPSSKDYVVETRTHAKYIKPFSSHQNPVK